MAHLLPKKYRHTAHTRAQKNHAFLRPGSSYGSTAGKRDGNTKMTSQSEKEVVGTTGVAISHTIIEVGRLLNVLTLASDIWS